MVSTKNKYKIEYFIARPEKKAEIKVSAVITNTRRIQRYFTSIRCFIGIFSSQDKNRAKPNQALQRQVVASVQKLFKDEL